MIDLTPIDVRKKRGDFSKQMRGYEPAEVDGFLELVAERLEVLVKENLTLKERAARLGDQVRSQEGREKAVQEALVTAQELREDILGQARREADLLQREAEARAEQIRREIEAETERLKRDSESEAERVVEDARGRMDDLHASLQELDRRRSRFLKSFRALLERELGDVEVEENRTPMEEEALEIDLQGSRWEDAGSGPTPDVRADEVAAEDQREDQREDEPDPIEATESNDSVVPTDALGEDSDPDPDDGAYNGHEPGADLPTPVAIETLAADESNVREHEARHDAPPEADSDEDTWTSTLVYDDGETGADDDTTVRGG